MLLDIQLTQKLWESILPVTDILLKNPFTFSSSTPSQQFSSFTNNQCIISGNYRNFATNSLVGFGSANRLGNDNTTGTTLILDNFNAYQLNEVTAGQDSGGGVVVLKNWSIFWPTYVFSTGSTLVVKNSIIYSSGSTPIFNWYNNGLSNKTPTILLDGLLTNKDITGNFIFDGSVDISSNLSRLLY